MTQKPEGIRRNNPGKASPRKQTGQKTVSRHSSTRLTVFAPSL